jgi:hypothetical protein
MAVRDSNRVQKLEVNLSPIERAGLDRLASEIGISSECMAQLAISEKLARAGVLQHYLDFQRQPITD